MLKKVKENKKLEIIQKINTFVAFCIVNGKKFENEKIAIINKYINHNINNNNTDDLEIYIKKNKNCCFITIYFVDKITQKDLANFKLPNIF